MIERYNNPEDWSNPELGRIVWFDENELLQKKMSKLATYNESRTDIFPYKKEKMQNKLDDVRISIDEEIGRTYERYKDSKNDWIENGYREISKNIWNKTNYFIKKLLIPIVIFRQEKTKNPEILPCSNGSIDLLWNDGDFELLINISQENNKVQISGESYKFPEEDIEGTFNYNLAITVCIEWLKKIL